MLMETPLYKFDFNIINSRANVWRKDYMAAPDLKNALNYAYCLYCLCLRRANDDDFGLHYEEVKANSRRLKSVYDSLGRLRYFSKTVRAASQAIAYYYCESLNIISKRQSLAELMETCAEIRRLYIRNGSETALSYASILEQIASAQMGAESDRAFDKLAGLYKKNKRQGIDFYYTSALMKRIDSGKPDKAMEYYLTVKKLYEENPDDLRLNYLYSVSNCAAAIGWEKAENELAALSPEDGAETSYVLAHTLRKLMFWENSENRMQILSKLERIYAVDKSLNVATEYAFALYTLSGSLSSGTAEYVDTLERLYLDTQNGEIAFLYAKGLLNMLYSGERPSAIDKIYSLYSETGDCRIAVEYAEGLITLAMTSDDINDYSDCAEKLKKLYDDTGNTDLARKYASSLLALLPKCAPADASAAIAELRRLKTLNTGLYFESAEIMASSMLLYKNMLTPPDLSSDNQTKLLASRSLGLLHGIEINIFPDGGAVCIDDIEQRLAAISQWVEENRRTLKKYSFISFYGRKILNKQWRYDGTDIIIGPLSLDKCIKLMNEKSIDVFCENGKIQFFRICYIKDAAAGTDRTAEECAFSENIYLS